MVKKALGNRYILVIGLFLIVALGITGFLLFKKLNPDNFKAPGKDWNSSKKVEDYFVERLRMSPQEAFEIRSKPGVDGTVDLGN